jgi:copper chaperone
MNCACACSLPKAVLVILAIAGAASLARCGDAPAPAAKVVPATLNPETLAPNAVVLKVEGLACEGCVADVTEELQSVPGVETAKVVLAEGRAYVTLAQAEPASVQALLDKVGANPSHKASVEAKGSSVK